MMGEGVSEGLLIKTLQSMMDAKLSLLSFGPAMWNGILTTIPMIPHPANCELQVVLPLLWFMANPGLS